MSILDIITYKCFWCKKDVLTKPVLVEKGDRTMISGEFAFHLSDTHGWPIEVTEEAFNDFFRRKHGVVHSE